MYTKHYEGKNVWDRSDMNVWTKFHQEVGLILSQFSFVQTFRFVYSLRSAYEAVLIFFAHADIKTNETTTSNQQDIIPLTVFSHPHKKRFKKNKTPPASRHRTICNAQGYIRKESKRHKKLMMPSFPDTRPGPHAPLVMFLRRWAMWHAWGKERLPTLPYGSCLRKSAVLHVKTHHQHACLFTP